MHYLYGLVVHKIAHTGVCVKGIKQSQEKLSNSLCEVSLILYESSVFILFAQL